MIDLHGKEAAGYLRASDDRGYGSALEGMSVSGQEDEMVELAEEHRAHLPKERIFCDNNISASKYSTKKRDDWDKMLRLVGTGTIDLLYMWECSRGSRRHLEWATFLDLIERHKVLIFVISKQRVYDPTDSGDWEILATEGVKAASESNQISTRVRRGMRKARRLRRPLGRPPLGWRSEYDTRTGKMLTWVTDERPMAVVRELFERVLSGEPMLRIAVDLNNRVDLPEEDPLWVPLTREQGRWRPDSIKAVLSSPTHIGKFWGKDKDGKRVLIDGAWEGAIDEDVWWRTYNLLHAPDRRRRRPGSTKYLLTNVARCGVCGSWMGAGHSKYGEAILRCRGVNDDNTPKDSAGHVTVRMKWIDDYVRDEIVAMMCEEDAVEALTGDVGEEQSELRAQAAAIRSDIAAMNELLQQRAVSPRDYADYRAKWEPEAERMEEEAQSGMHAGKAMALRMVEEARAAGFTGAELREALLRSWPKIPLHGRKEIVRAMTDSVIVNKGRRGARTFDPGRVEIL